MLRPLNICHLSDHELLASARELARQERYLNIRIIDHLKEIEARGLHIRRGYSSLFEYAVKELGFSEGAAHYRIQAKKLYTDYPEVKQQLEEGALTLTGAGQLQSAFDRHARRQRKLARERAQGGGESGGVSGPGAARDAAAAAAAGASGAAADAGEGAAAAEPAAAAGVAGAAGEPGEAAAAADAGTPLTESVKRGLIEQAQGKSTRQIGELIAALDPELVRPRERLRPLGGDRWEIKAVIDGECQRGLERLLHVMSHINPAMGHGELLQRLVADGLVRYDPARRPVRVRQPPSTLAAQPMADGAANSAPGRRALEAQQRQNSPPAPPAADRAANSDPGPRPLEVQQQQNRLAVLPVAIGQVNHQPRPHAAHVRQHPGTPAAGPAGSGAPRTVDPQPSSSPPGSGQQPKPTAAAPAPPINCAWHQHGAPAQHSSEPQQRPGQRVAATVAADPETAGTDANCARFTPPPGPTDRAPQHAAPVAGSYADPTWAPKSDDLPVDVSRKATGPGSGCSRATVTRTIPAAVRRHIWIRDGGRCTYRDPESGRCCGSMHLVQIDHVQPYAMGGAASVENLRLLCGAHNRDRVRENRSARPGGG